MDFSKINFYEIKEFWKPLTPTKNSLIIEKNKFYILRSKEKICIPSNLAGEMIPYDTGIGDFRAHYAGFFDPGFGLTDLGASSTRAVLEVRSHDVPFLIEQGQTVCRLIYEPMANIPNFLYGEAGSSSNYQAQGLKLAKHFI
jgi:dCTP deaminase